MFFSHCSPKAYVIPLSVQIFWWLKSEMYELSFLQQWRKQVMQSLMNNIPPWKVTLPKQVGQQLPLRRTDLEQVTEGQTWEKQWTCPLLHVQLWQGLDFHTSPSLYVYPVSVRQVRFDGRLEICKDLSSSVMMKISYLENFISPLLAFNTQNCHSFLSHGALCIEK